VRVSVEESELDVVGKQFGVRITKRREGVGDLFELFVEDDGMWYHTIAFDVAWAKDIAEVMIEANNLSKPAEPISFEDGKLRSALLEISAAADTRRYTNMKCFPIVVTLVNKLGNIARTAIGHRTIE
jgi:hypothetical protein